MKLQLVHTLNLVLIINCVIIVAKNSTESEKKLDTELNQSIFAEGLSQQNQDEEPKRRIIGRKGVSMNTTEPSSNETQISHYKTIHDESSHSSIVDLSTISPITVHKNNITNNTVNTVPSKNNQSDHTILDTHNNTISTNLSSPTVSNTSIPLKISTIISTTPTSKPLSTATTTTTTTTTTKLITTSTAKTTPKPKKPEITYSADDDVKIRESEKNINYNVANEKSDEIPKVEQDIDRHMLSEKRAQSSYMLYLGLVFALPTTFVLINIAYRRIKNYLEVRHYTRVDFLVDGMYVS
ncbi:rho GTPase-activating protein gacF [Chironomus tepperi]|uniref:rho GTPase-activating protein gacF n=1 Tax=Chironomus tepperi TaxID=113505 RepID=UPI00391FC65F